MIADRLVGAPISWGVCEVPDWGYQLSPDRVLKEMSTLGLRATEFGPIGFLPSDPNDRIELLDGYGLKAVGGFLPLRLHDRSLDVIEAVDPYIDDCLSCGATVIVLAAMSGGEGYDDRGQPDEATWQTLLGNLDVISDHAEARGVLATIHPHAGTMVENQAHVTRVIEGSRCKLCLDTGHLLVGGTDPVAFGREHPDRVGHVHLKDVNGDLAQQVIDDNLTFSEAVCRGLFVPLGKGDVDLATLVATLESTGYSGYYVLEQDVMLAGEPVGEGPAADVRECLSYLHRIAS